jgi:hypothetical protein
LLKANNAWLDRQQHYLEAVKAVALAVWVVSLAVMLKV